MTILWVENHQRFAQIAFKNFLSAHVVTIAPSIAVARKYLSEGQFDLVLLDYDLDDGKGIELVSEILNHLNQLNQLSRPKLIATSSHAAGNQALLDAGADAVCSKMEFVNIGQLIDSLTDHETENAINRADCG